MNKVGKNLIYNVSYQILLIIVPLILSPYLSKTIGAEGIGIYSFTYSVAYYFMIFTMLGISNYGVRAIAKCGDDEELFKLTFVAIYKIQFALTLIVVIAYIIYCSLICSDYIVCAWCQILCIIAYGLDISWVYFGRENFRYVVWRNAIVKFSNLILVLGFVRDSNDVWKYTLIMAVCTLTGQILLWPTMLKYICTFRCSVNQSLKHIKGITILFLPVLAISIFSYMDKVMLGTLSDISQTGFYECSEKIVNIPKSFIQAVGGVMLPHTAALIAKGLSEEVDKSIKITFFYVQLFAAPFVFGILAIASDFSVLFWGKDFAECGKVIIFLVPALLFSVLGNVVRTQILIPKEMDNQYTISLILGAIVNCVINFALIRHFGAVGAALGTVAAEITLCVYQFYSVRHSINIWEIFKRNLMFYPFAFVMYIIVYAITRNMDANWFKIVIMVLTGAVTYCIMAVLYIVLSKDYIINEVRTEMLKRIYRR